MSSLFTETCFTLPIHTVAQRGRGGADELQPFSQSKFKNIFYKRDITRVDENLQTSPLLPHSCLLKVDPVKVSNPC